MAYCYTYMLQCADGSLYTGWTKDLDKRLAKHNAGKGSRYTRVRRPVILVWQETFTQEHLARSREVKVKQLSRQEKLELVANYKKGCPLE